ncbi:helix-hairpin-helix domain-containing protein, partial [bacterium]|nr:helix-hairpin-helix domain-containing protein [bacterium]
MKKTIILLISLVVVLGVASLAQATVDINTASVTELQTLPRIGPGLAQAIIDYREIVGPFQSVTDITNVPRIGEQTYERLKDLITVGGSIPGGSMRASSGSTVPSDAASTEYTPITKATPTPEPSVESIMRNFNQEPTIREVQIEAIRYAEIDPIRFAEWRQKVKARGLWPERLQFTIGHDTDDDEDYTRSKTVGISGGTAYIGPD